MSNTPTPPAGYKLVKGEDIKDRVPEGAMVWKAENVWGDSGFCGFGITDQNFKNFYAIPETKPEHPNKAAKVAKLKDIPDDAYIFSQWINHLNDWMPFRPTKKSEVTDPYSACWFAYTDASGAHPDYYTAPYDIKTSVVEKPEPAIPEVGPQPPEGYVLRHRAKNKAEDIRKAIHELRLILKLEYGEDLP